VESATLALCRAAHLRSGRESVRVLFVRHFLTTPCWNRRTWKHPNRHPQIAQQTRQTSRTARRKKKFVCLLTQPQEGLLFTYKSRGLSPTKAVCNPKMFFLRTLPLDTLHSAAHVSPWTEGLPPVNGTKTRKHTHTLYHKIETTQARPLSFECRVECRKAKVLINRGSSVLAATDPISPNCGSSAVAHTTSRLGWPAI